MPGSCTEQTALQGRPCLHLLFPAGSLQPGALVAARVRSVLSDGLLVSFLTFFSGTIDPFHLGVDPGTDWKNQFRLVRPCPGRTGLWIYQTVVVQGCAYLN